MKRNKYAAAATAHEILTERKMLPGYADDGTDDSRSTRITNKFNSMRRRQLFRQARNPWHCMKPDSFHKFTTHSCESTVSNENLTDEFEMSEWKGPRSNPHAISEPAYSDWGYTKNPSVSRVCVSVEIQTNDLLNISLIMLWHSLKPLGDPYPELDYATLQDPFSYSSV
jgi:hypothetical protein